MANQEWILAREAQDASGKGWTVYSHRDATKWVRTYREALEVAEAEVRGGNYSHDYPAHLLISDAFGPDPGFRY